MEEALPPDLTKGTSLAAKTKYIAELLKVGYSFEEDVEIEGLFIDLEDNKVVLLGLTNRHLVIGNIYSESLPMICDLSSLLPLKWLTITVEDARQRILRVVFCTAKCLKFRLCDIDPDQGSVWLEFVSLIHKLDLDHVVMWKPTATDASGDGMDSEKMNGSNSRESISILANHFGSSADNLNDFDGRYPSSNEEFLKRFKRLSVQKKQADTKVKEQNHNSENRFKRIERKKSDHYFTMNELFTCVHKYHIGQEYPYQSDQLQATKASKKNSDSEWSTSSKSSDEDFHCTRRPSLDQGAPYHFGSVKKSKLKTLKEFFTPRCLKIKL
ncbi:hypothetical protein SNE40_002110 [Patella caerulea]|uniref:Uncharacterized protein n=1 Tax=Patella caerulea TaxID=87958 RepID=A0AAN8PYQ0_PATCE